jgi:regulatory protein
LLVKLANWGVEPEKAQTILEHLEDENFLSEKRFAKMYTTSKVNQNKWGKVRIELELMKRNIPEKYISEAINEIDEEKYLKNFNVLVSFKSKESLDLNPLIRKQKIIAFLISKGYEEDYIQQNFHI